MSIDEILRFFREHPYVVEATVHADGSAQAAVIGVAATIVDGRLELCFDTSNASRKHRNLLRDGRIALAAWHGAVSVQLEASADQPAADSLDRLKEAYFATFPDGMERAAWPDIAYWRLRPTWIRVSDFSTTPPTVREMLPA